MKVTINIKLHNHEFEQNIADDFYGGEETDDNVKYLWEDEFEVKGDVTSFKIKNAEPYVLRGLYPDNKEFNFEINDVTICECINNKNQVSQFVFSKKLVKSTDKVVDDKGDITFEVILKDKLPMENPMDGIYILTKDFPKELLAQ